ncbi:MAG: ISL3 family transposase [Bacilli bacterium]|nr:ISL3 family transposase [Bacilli bacterium]
MIDSGDILSLLGIQREKVAFIDACHMNATEDKIIISLIDNRDTCPYCRSKNIAIHGYYKVNINNSIIKTRLLHVEIDMRRYKCKDCGKTFRQNFNFYSPGTSISTVAKISILEALKENISYSFIARQYGVSTNTVINYFDALPQQPRLQLGEVICVDEFHFNNRDNPKLKFPFVISDPFSSKIIDIIESRRWDYLRNYFCKISIFERSKVKYFVSDMNETYRSLKKTFFNDSVHIVDHFHIMKIFNNAIQKIRTKIMKKHKNEEETKEYRFLKKHWKMFVCNRSRLKDFRIVIKRTGFVFDWQILVDTTLRKYPELYYAYWSREEFNRDVTKLTGWLETKKSIDYFIQKFGHCEIEEMHEIAHTISNWYEEIINAYSKTTYGFFLSNAVAEANNDNIQTLVDVCYGLNNFKRSRNRILYINRNKKDI